MSAFLAAGRRDQFKPADVPVLFILTWPATGAIGRRARTLRARSSRAHIPVCQVCGVPPVAKIYPGHCHQEGRRGRGMTVTLPDVSEFQSPASGNAPNWAGIKSQNGGAAIIRVGYGNAHLDGM